MTLLLVLAVCAGGGAGAACRYGIGRGVRPRDPGAFPLGVRHLLPTHAFPVIYLYVPAWLYVVWRGP